MKSNFGRFGIYIRTSNSPSRFALAGVPAYLPTGKKRTREIANHAVTNEDRPAEWAEAHLVETGETAPGYADTLPGEPLFSYSKGTVPKDRLPVVTPSGDGAALQVSLF